MPSEGSRKAPFRFHRPLAASAGRQPGQGRSNFGGLSPRRNRTAQERIRGVIERAIPDERQEVLTAMLIRVWIAACVVLFVIVLILRVVHGTVRGAWLDAFVLTLGAPLAVMLLDFVAGWVWFVFWLISWPVRRMRR